MTESAWVRFVRRLRQNQALIGQGPVLREFLFVLADARRTGGTADHLAAFDHLSRWSARNAQPDWVDAFEGHLVPHDAAVTRWVAAWAYRQADWAGATVWERGREGGARSSLAGPARRLRGARGPELSGG
jgi:hypothetical protein